MFARGFVWFCIVLHGLAWFCLVLRGFRVVFVWFCMILCGFALFHIVHVVLNDLCDSHDVLFLQSCVVL